MKNLILTVTVSLLSMVALSQTVTINTSGTKNKQLRINGKVYPVSNASNSDVTVTTIADLAPGSHTLELVRSTTGSRTTTARSGFTLREGYDLKITISTNGSISSVENRVSSNENIPRSQMNTAAFNRLLSQVKAKNSSSARASYLKTQLEEINKRMTSNQARQLIQLVNSENLRFELVKQVYAAVSDTENFSVVMNLLNNPANRTAIQEFIASGDEAGSDDASSVLTAENFKVIYNEVIAESGNANKTYYLTNFFSRDNVYFSSQQASQLISLVADEAGRLSLARLSYRGIRDRENFDQVSRLISSSSGRTELATYINTYSAANPVSPVSNGDFEKIYQSVYRQNSSSLRFTTINNAFTNPGTYFTATQAARLIPLVNDDASRLSLSKSVYRILVDKTNYSQFNNFLSSGSRAALSAFVNEQAIAGNPVNVMADADFNKLYQDANSSWSSITKYNLVSEAFKSGAHYFSGAQIRQLINLFQSENDKLVLAKLSIDNLADRKEIQMLYELFGTVNRKELEDFYNGVVSGNVIVKVPMAESEFNTLYRNLQFTFGIGAKYNSITELFSSRDKYFTVEQAKLLIQLLSSESNRLELAKAVYDNISDPANFSLMFDVLPSQNSKNELRSFVESSASK